MAYVLALQSAMGDADSRRALGAEHLAPACTARSAGSTCCSKAGYRDAANRRWSSDKKKCPRHRQVML